MALTDITQKIISDAQAKADKILSDASVRASEIINDAQKLGKSKKEEKLKVAEDTAEKTKTRMISSAELDAKKIILNAKQDKISMAIDKTVEFIRNMSNESYQQLLTKLIAEKADGDEEILLCEHDKKNLSPDFVHYINVLISRESVKSSMTLADDCADIPCGFILRRGDISKNFAFDFVLRCMRDELETDTLRILSEGE